MKNLFKLALFFVSMNAFATTWFSSISTLESNPATTAFLNLSNNGNGIAWRNAANSGNIFLNVNSSNQLTYNGGILFSSGGVLQAAAEPAHTGDVTNSAGSLALAIAAGAVTNADLAGSIAGSKLVGTDITSLANLVTVGALTGGSTGAGFTVALSTSTITGTLADARLPSSMATKTFTGVTSFPGSSSIDGSGNASFGGTVTSTGVFTASSTTDATSSTAAGTIVSGGLAVAKKANIGTTLTVGTTSQLTGNVNIGTASAAAATVQIHNASNDKRLQFSHDGTNSIIDSTFGSSGATGLVLQISDTAALTIDTSSNATFAAGMKAPSLSTSSAAQTGTLCWTTGTGNFTVDTTTTCLLSTAKIKQDIESLDIGLNTVMKLRPVSYQLKDSHNPEHLGRQVGFISEEVGEIDDRLISHFKEGREEDGIKAGDPAGVRYMQMTAVLVKAIQEQQAEILELKKELRRRK